MNDNISGIVGLDLSLTGTGFARVTENSDSNISIETKFMPTRADSGTRITRYRRIAKAIVRSVEKNDIVFIEDYAYGIKPKASSIVTLGELGGIVRLALALHTGNEPLTITTGEMRKYLC